MWKAMRLFLVLTVLVGVVYPAVVTVAAMAMPYRAQGSLIRQNGAVVGSELIGQSFANPKYFWSRPSATAPDPYNASASTPSNLGPTNKALTDAVSERARALREANPNATGPLPEDLLTASASGLDPHISPQAAMYQVPRVAAERSLPEATVRTLVDKYTEGRQWGIFGEPRVSVLKLNLALDSLGR